MRNFATSWQSWELFQVVPDTAGKSLVGGGYVRTDLLFFFRARVQAESE